MLPQFTMTLRAPNRVKLDLAVVTALVTVELAHLAQQFIDHGRYLRSWRPKTVDTYKHGLGLFAKFMNGDVPSRETLQRFVIAMREKGLTPGGCNTHIRTVNSFLSWLHDEGYLPQPLHIPLLPKPRSAPRLLTRLEVWRILSKRPVAPGRVRSWALLAFLVDTGARIEEALLLQRDDLDLDLLHARLTGGKGGHQRIVPISPEGRKILFRWLQEREKAGFDGPYVFAAGDGGHLSYRNAYRDIKQLAALHGVSGPHVHPHAFRSYFAVSYLQNGGDLFTLSRILGHTSVATTQIYLKSMGVEQIGEVHLRVSPLANLAKGKPKGDGDGR